MARKVWMDLIALIVFVALTAISLYENNDVCSLVFGALDAMTILAYRADTENEEYTKELESEDRGNRCYADHELRAIPLDFDALFPDVALDGPDN